MFDPFSGPAGCDRSRRQLAAAGFDGGQGGEVRGQGVGGKGFHVEAEEGGRRDTEIEGAIGAIDDHGDADGGGTSLADDFQGFRGSPAAGDDVFDDEGTFSLSEVESAAEDEGALLFFCENEAQPQLAGDFLSDDQAAHGWGDDGGRVPGAGAVGEGAAEAFDGGHILEGQGALEELSGAEAATEDEMAFQEGAGAAENVEDFGLGHGGR